MTPHRVKRQKIQAQIMVAHTAVPPITIKDIQIHQIAIQQTTTTTTTTSGALMVEITINLHHMEVMEILIRCPPCRLFSCHTKHFF